MALLLSKSTKIENIYNKKQIYNKQWASLSTFGGGFSRQKVRFALLI
jgi:hypothetical protein